MAKMTYGVFLEHMHHCYIISNAGLEFAEDTAPESFTNPPIKMTVLWADHDDMQYAFSANDNDLNHPELVNNLMQALRGELPGWILTGVNVAADGIYLIYRTEHEPVLSDSGLLCGDGQVLVSGNYKLRFEIDHANGLPVEYYEVEHREVPRYVLEHHNIPDPQAAGRDTYEVSVVRITEFIGTRKRRLLELRDDNHGQPCEYGRYCRITEY